MIRKILGMIFTIIIFISSSAWLDAADNTFTNLTFIITTTSGSQNFSLESTVGITFQVENNALNPILAHKYINTVDGYIMVYISYEDAPNNFKRYTHPGWGIKDNYNLFESEIGVGESISATGEILDNIYLFETTSIQTALAFPSLGSYYIKARFYSLGYDYYVESNTISIVVW